MTATVLPRSRLHPADLLRVGTIGLRSRRLRSLLSALGIAIGIAAMVGVLGISESSKAELLSSLDRLGTNLLTVEAGGGIGGGSDNRLPVTAPAMLGRIGPVDVVSSVSPVPANVRRTDLVPETHTEGIVVKAADPHLPAVLAGTMADGVWLDEAKAHYPVVVLGAVAAERLGITDVADGPRIRVGDHWFTVVGILEPLELAPDIDRSALIGHAVADELFDIGDAPGAVYLRAHPDDVEAVQSVVAATANPEAPDEVEVARPSDALAARAAANSALTALFVGLGAVALLVGGIGVANVMFISVLERRSEIGLRRALGATKGHITVQFLAEALLLSTIGGVGGVMLGGVVATVFALAQGWDVVVPLVAVAGAPGAAVAIGGVAGLYPALRAGRVTPTAALRSG